MNNYKQFRAVDYLALARSYWEERKTILIITLIFGVFGLIFAYSSQEEFVSQVKLMPENSQESQLNGLSGLARQFGVAATSTSETGIPVSLYPDVAKNLVMMKQLMNYEVSIDDNNQVVTLKDYFLRPAKPSLVSTLTKNTIGLPFRFIKWARSKLPSPSNEMRIQERTALVEDNTIIQQFQDSEWAMIENLRGRITVTQDVDTGIIIVEVKMPDPLLAAKIAAQVVNFLTEYITNYRTEKTRGDVEFIEDRLAEAKINFEKAQTELASYTDRQRATTRATDDVERQRLENEFSIAFNIYNIMAQRLEETKIRLQEVTPAVSILDPPAVPNKRSEPLRIRTFLIFCVSGFTVGIVFVNLKNRIINYHE